MEVGQIVGVTGRNIFFAVEREITSSGLCSKWKRARPGAHLRTSRQCCVHYISVRTWLESGSLKPHSLLQQWGEPTFMRAESSFWPAPSTQWKPPQDGLDRTSGNLLLGQGWDFLPGSDLTLLGLSSKRLTWLRGSVKAFLAWHGEQLARLPPSFYFPLRTQGRFQYTPHQSLLVKQVPTIFLHFLPFPE